jgi:hypothetical protein
MMLGALAALLAAAAAALAVRATRAPRSIAVHPDTAAPPGVSGSIPPVPTERAAPRGAEAAASVEKAGARASEAAAPPSKIPQPGAAPVEKAGAAAPPAPGSRVASTPRNRTAVPASKRSLPVRPLPAPTGFKDPMQ